MLEAPRTYPLLRRRRRRRLLPRLQPLATGRAARIALALVLLAGIAAAIVRLAERADVPAAAVSYQRGEAALAQGNYSAARNHFIAAVTANPGDGIAQSELARTYLLLGDGIAAQGAIDRAASAALDAEKLHQLRAAALLLQGDPDDAIAEADRAEGAYVPFARRARARALAAKGDRPAAMRTLQALLAVDPRDAGAWRDLGRIRFDNGDVSGAAAAATRATALDPTDLAALVLRGEVVRSQYGLVAALPWFEAALRRDAYFHPALIEYAGTLGDAGRYADSLDAARRALAARPGSPQALYLMAVIAARAGNLDLAGDLLDKTGGALDGLPGGLLLSGGVDYAAGRYEQAVLKWRALLGEQPMNLAARRLLGAALLRSGDAAAALVTLRPTALRSDADSYTLALVARAFEAQGKRDWAARFLDRATRPVAPAARPFGQDDSQAVLAEAIKDAPGDPAAVVDYVRGLLENGQWAQALAQSDVVVRASPGAAPAQLLAGDVQAAGGRFGPAAASYARAANLRFDQPALLRLVEASLQSGNRTGAGDALALYLAQNPEAVAARRLLANLQLGAGAYRAAVDTLESLRGDLGAHDAVLLTQLAYAYTGAGDPQGALGYARAAYALQPMNPAAADAYGWASFEAGDTPAALQLLRKAVQIAPLHAAMRWHYAQALADAGRHDAARQSIAVALRDPAFADRAAAGKLLRAL